MKFATIGLSTILLIASTATLAESHSQHMPGNGMHPADMHTAAQGHTGQGVVNRIDPQHNKLNMTHGPIDSLGWPAMTMDFTVKDAALLNGLEPGQKVTFDMVNAGQQKYVVTRILPQK